MDNTKLNFGQALEELKQGRRVSRECWEFIGMNIELQIPDITSKMTLPYIFMNFPVLEGNGTIDHNNVADRIPWLPSQADILSSDWTVIE